jgi:hypothetical protein
MDSHFINVDAQSAMTKNDFEAFLRNRDQALLAEVRAQLTLGQDPV